MSLKARPFHGAIGRRDWPREVIAPVPLAVHGVGGGGAFPV